MNAAPGGTRLGLLPALLRTCLRRVHTRPSRRPPPKGFQGPEGHGEHIWVFVHRRTEQVIFSFKDRLDGFHSHKQLPFNGKKTKPAKLRKDYWSPMALMRFPPGMGSVGRSVFQKLRELKHLHEVAWPDEFRYKPESEFTEADKHKIEEEEEKGNKYRPVRTKQERGKALNAQKKNVVADMAVVLAGKGGGNKMLATASEEAAGGRDGLVAVTVEWSNDQDREFAEAWSPNVTHALFEKPTYASSSVPQKQVVAAPEEPVKARAEVAPDT